MKKKFRHEMYKETTIENDIMLLQLSSPVPEKPAIMNFDSQFPVSRELLTTVGLGRLDEDLPSPEILHYVRKNEFPFSNCRFKYSNMDKDLQICAGGDGEKDSCFGRLPSSLSFRPILLQLTLNVLSHKATLEALSLKKGQLMTEKLIF